MFLGEIDTYRGIDTYCVATVVQVESGRMNRLVSYCTVRLILVIWSRPNLIIGLFFFSVGKKGQLGKKILFNPRPTKPFFVTWFTKGGGYHPLMNLKLTGPKYNCLVPWYRVGSLLSIDTKIMKIGWRMTSQWRFQTCPDSKSGFSVKIDQNWKKNQFFP